MQMSHERKSLTRTDGHLDNLLGTQMEPLGLVGSTLTEGWDACCVAPSLWIGAASAFCLPCIQNLGITHVLSVMRDAPPAIPGVRHLVIDALDTETEFLLDSAIPALNFMQAAFDANGCVLVHCQHGHSRSVTIAAAFLMHSRKITASAAHDAIASARRIDINPAFQIQLLILQHAVDLAPTLHITAHSRWRMARLQAHIFASREFSSHSMTDLRPFAAPAFPEVPNDAAMKCSLRCLKCSETIALQGNVV
jgi:hypothetical protein